jgi:hypothetical protein
MIGALRQLRPLYLGWHSTPSMDSTNLSAMAT